MWYKKNISNNKDGEKKYNKDGVIVANNLATKASSLIHFFVTQKKKDLLQIYFRKKKVLNWVILAELL